MYRELLTLEAWVVPVISLSGGVILGVILEYLTQWRLAKLSRQPGKKALEVIIASLRGMVVFWCFLAGAYIATHTSQLPEEAHAIITKVLFTAAVISVTVFVYRVGIAHLKQYAQRAQGVMPSTSIFINIVRILIIVAGVFIILDCYGISVTNMVAALGLGGLAIALALQPTLVNLFAGVQILASKQIRVGDYVKLDTGEDGYVADIGWRMTSLKTLSNNIIFVPNSKMSGAVVTNFHLPDKGIDLRVQVCVSAASDHTAVEKETLEIAREIVKEAQGDIPGFDPYVHYNSITDTSTNFTVVLRAREYFDQFRMRDKFIRKLTERLKKEGVFKSVAVVDKVV